MQPYSYKNITKTWFKVWIKKSNWHNFVSMKKWNMDIQSYKNSPHQFKIWEERWPNKNSRYTSDVLIYSNKRKCHPLMSNISRVQVCLSMMISHL